MGNKNGLRVSGNPARRREAAGTAIRRRDLPPLDGEELDHHAAGQKMLNFLRRIPAEPSTDRWDAAEVPHSAPDIARLERLWAETFAVPSSQRYGVRDVLDTAWKADVAPAALIYAVSYHFPAIPPWQTPLPPMPGVVDRLRERFTCSRSLEHSDLMLACFVWRMTYIPAGSPPPPAGSIPRWLTAYETGLQRFADSGEAAASGYPGVPG